MVRPRKPPSQTWRTFLTNHVSELVSTDFFTVHTISFEVLFVFVVLAHDRRRVLHFNVTAHPTAEWTAQQIVEAFPFDSAPKYLLRDRDQIYGYEFRKQLEVMSIEEVLSAPRVSLATRLCGTRHWLDPAGMFGPRYYLQRGIFASHASSVLPLLPRIAVALIARQGFAGTTIHTVGRQSHRDS